MYANDDCLVLANQVSADDEVIFYGVNEEYYSSYAKI